jgi:hypothetical protein
MVSRAFTRKMACFEKLPGRSSEALDLAPALFLPKGKLIGLRKNMKSIIRSVLVMCATAISLRPVAGANSVIYVNFDSVPTTANTAVNATAYLASFGIGLANVSPPGSVYIVNQESYCCYYVFASSPPNLLDGGYGVGTRFSSYTLVFPTPLQSLSFTRCAYGSVATPSWTATAYAGSQAVDSVSVCCLNSDYSDPGAHTYLLNGPGITSLTITADGYNFAGINSPPLDDFYLTVTDNSPTPSLVISSVQTPASSGGLNTFVSTDRISLTANVTPPTVNMPVQWTVTGLQAAAGISGFPSGEVDNTDSQGISSFSFSPSANAAFVKNRQANYTSGTKMVNSSIGFDVTAQIQPNGHTISASLSQTSLNPLLQDVTDILRQEYVDFQLTVPSRSVVVPSLGPGYNQGNYTVQVSVDLPGHYSDILTAYGGSSVQADGGPVDANGQSCAQWPWQAGTIPAQAGVTVSSGFRNPRRNKAVHGKANSYHMLGRALDLQPAYDPRSGLSLHGVLYPALYNAANSVGTAIAEKYDNGKPVQTCPGDPNENQIHVQW